MPKKNKTPKKTKEKGKKILARNLSVPEDKKKKEKNELKRSAHSASEIYQLRRQDSVDDANSPTPPIQNGRPISPPQQNSRPTSPLNFFLPILEYGFSWPRRKSPFKNQGENKNIRSPILSSPDSGHASSPVCDDSIFSPSREEGEIYINRRQRALSPVALFKERNVSPLSIVLETESQCSAEEQNASSKEVDAVMDALDDAISGSFDFENENESKSCDNKTSGSGSSDDSEVSAINEASSQNEASFRESLGGIMIKDGKSSVSKRVRFSLENRSLRKSKSCEIIRTLSEPCVFAVTVKCVEILPSSDNGEGSKSVEIDSFQALVGFAQIIN